MEVVRDIFDDIEMDSSVASAVIRNVRLLINQKSLCMDIVPSIMIEKNVVDDFKQALKRKYTLKEVIINFKYEDNILFNSDTIHTYFEYITPYLVERFSSAASIMRDAQIRLLDNHLAIRLKYGGKDILLSNSVDRTIADIVAEQFGIVVVVSFEEEEFDKESYLKQKEEELDLSVEHIVLSAAEDTKDNKQDTVILGKPIKGKCEQIDTIKEDSGRVVIECDVFHTELKELRGSRNLLTLHLTDGSNSIVGKMFLEPNMANKILGKINVGTHLKVKGDAQYDKYMRDICIGITDISYAHKDERIDSAQAKRVELHVHTQMSALDAVNSAKSLIKRAAGWGHKAIAITDHGVVQAFPEAYHAGEEFNIKILYGVEAYLTTSAVYSVYNEIDMDLDGDFVVFDIETTGLSPKDSFITEIAGVRLSNGKIVETFSTFVNPGVAIPKEITKLTGITDKMVENAPTIETVLPDFLEFSKNCALVAHNASFDVGFLQEFSNRLGILFNRCYVDTLQLSRSLIKGLAKYKLDVVAEHLGIPLFEHHRAISDAECTAGIFLRLCEMLRARKIVKLSDINSIAFGLKNQEPTYHAIIFVKNMTGLRNLYQLISMSHIDYFHKRPRIPKNVYEYYKEGLMIGSACEAGELYQAIIEKKSDSEIENIVKFYDYLEIQPIGNNQFLIDAETVKDEEELKENNKKIVALGERYNKLVVAACDVHFIDPETEVIRRILQAGQGYADADRQAPLYLRTTDEMLSEFSYLGDEKAYEVVVTNTNKIADQIEDKIRPIPKDTYTPEIVGAQEDIQNMSYNRAKEIYGENLPKIVQDRIDKELGSIIKHGFSVMYMIAHKLVAKSLSDGYLVGSRGSVGSSFIAFLTDITEVNALSPHYVCKSCKYSEFITDDSVASGVDMPDKACPNCGELLYKDGHDIPFETFLGFDGDKEPDIDLNFSGDYQSTAHKYTEELFGAEHVFRAGTIGTFADKTAYGYVKKYYEERNKIVNDAEITRLVKGFEGIKRTTGQHPGGLMIVPKNNEIYEFTPVQRPANDQSVDIITTHFDYHSISGKLLKLDILGHDDPTMIRMLEDLTGTNATEISLSDPDVMALFTSTNSLNVTAKDINSEVGTFAVPEFGTKFVRQMLVDTKPTTFSELVRISGLSHGTDVWLNNAQELIRAGTATLSEAICTRDDIMTYLIHRGLDSLSSFKIMEDVRKGKGLKPEYIELMEENDIPDWYIDSCQKIKYMFPKAHAVAYVTMAYRIAYYKVHYPTDFYIAYFTVRADDFDAQLMAVGQDKVRQMISEIEKKGMDASQKEKNVLTILEVCNEMYARRLEFLPMDLYKSDGFKFLKIDGKIRPPLNALVGLGDNAVRAIIKERENGEFATIEELLFRTKINKTAVEALKRLGVLENMPESAQLSLF